MIDFDDPLGEDNFFGRYYNFNDTMSEFMEK